MKTKFAITFLSTAVVCGAAALAAPGTAASARSSGPGIVPVHTVPASPSLPTTTAPTGSADATAGNSPALGNAATAPNGTPSNVNGNAIPNPTATSQNPLNRFGMNTNQFQASSNSVTGNSNQFNSNFVVGDEAATPSDRVLLQTLGQELETQLGVNSFPALPIHMLINNGAVTLTGTVPTADESQRIYARVQQTPGVLSVFNDLRVGNTTAAAPRPQPGFFGSVQSHAFSPADQALLSTVEQQAGAQLGINGASSTQLPVHFSIQNGVVGVTGQVASPQEKAALLAAIRRTPGVVRVVDDVSTTATGNTSINPTGAGNPFMNNNLPATGGPVTNRVFLNTTNNSGY